jgi:hypothetical protein
MSKTAKIVAAILEKFVFHGCPKYGGTLTTSVTSIITLCCPAQVFAHLSKIFDRSEKKTATWPTFGSVIMSPAFSVARPGTLTSARSSGPLSATSTIYSGSVGRRVLGRPVLVSLQHNIQFFSFRDSDGIGSPSV